MTDVFAEAALRAEQLLLRLAAAPGVVLTGVVDASGVSGGSIRGGAWTMHFSFAGWRLGHGDIDVRRLTVRQPVQQQELDAFRAQIKPYAVLGVRARFLDDEDLGGPQALLEAVIGEEPHDLGLNRLAGELQQPVTHIDGVLGALQLDRRVNWFSGEVPWGSNTVQVNLHPEGDGELRTALRVAHELWSNQGGWTIQVREFAATHLLALKNDSWRDDDEPALTAAEFAEKLDLEAVTVDADGGFEFWCSDGDLFSGHSVLVHGTLDGGLQGAEIAG